MSRTTKSKIQYILVHLVVLFLSLWAILRLYSLNLLIFTPLIPITFLIPGRIQGYYYRDMFKARRLLAEGKFNQSIECNSRFLSDIRLHTWKKKLIWLSWGGYSKDIEAIVLNNIGAAYLQLGDYEAAKGFFNDAIELDSLYPIPYYNLGIASVIQGDKETAKNCHKKSVELGYRKTSFDKVIHIGQQILANIESR